MKNNYSSKAILGFRPIGIVLLIVSILSSCGEGLPSEQYAKDKLNSNTKSPYELTDFKKTNGIKGTDKGQETYQMNFHALLVARDSLYTYAKFPRDTQHILKSDTGRVKLMLFRSPFESIHWEKISGFKKGDPIKEIDGEVRLNTYQDVSFNELIYALVSDIPTVIVKTLYEVELKTIDVLLGWDANEYKYFLKAY